MDGAKPLNPIKDGPAGAFRVADVGQIKAAAPALLPEQAGDVALVERRFWQDGGKGMLLTNSTGTGKTFSGLGVVRRFVDAGRGRVLVLAPGDGILREWEKQGKAAFGLTVARLKDVTDAGEGIVATTFANFRENLAIQAVKWDLVVADESHKLMAGEDDTKTLKALRLIAGHHTTPHLMEQAVAGRIPEVGVLEPAPVEESFKGPGAKDRWQRAREQWYGSVYRPWQARLKEVKEKRPELWRQTEAQVLRTRVLMLSASPFSYHKSLQLADGYLFDVEPGPNTGRYNEANGFDRFLQSYFGYRMRTGKLNAPPREVNVDMLERDFADKLMASGAMAGRQLQVAQDYSRDFVLLESKVAARIDEAMSALVRDYSFLNARMDYQDWVAFLEAFKAQASLPLIEKHLALGRKAVVFHNYKTVPPRHPFQAIMDMARKPGILEPVREQARSFMARFNDVMGLQFERAGVVDQLKAKFGARAVVYNGDVAPKEAAAGLASFNTDGSGVDIIIVQKDKGKEGLSLHDRTGRHQRVLINLGLPVEPTAAIQIEGRIYRHGVKSDAIIQYPVLHTVFEKRWFGSAIAERSRTAENLAMGSKARALEASFKQAFTNPLEDIEPVAGQGKGGKEADAMRVAQDPFDRALSDYYRREKNSRKRAERQGADFYATPEPLGMKLVRWADPLPGDRMLEPSAGDGAIGRFFPSDTLNTFVEPSRELAADLATVVPRGTILEHPFEELKRSRYAGIVMNPPFGRGGALAWEHLKRALGMAKMGGRVVAVLPQAPQLEEKLTAWMDSVEGAQFATVARIGLPAVTFEKAGTGVRTFVLVLEKTGPAQVPYQPLKLDLAAETVGELFAKLRDLDLPARKPMDDPSEIEGTEDGPLRAWTGDSGKSMLTLEAPVTDETVRKQLRELAEKWNAKPYYDGQSRVKGWSFWNEETRFHFYRTAMKLLSPEVPRPSGLTSLRLDDSPETTPAPEVVAVKAPVAGVPVEVVAEPDNVVVVKPARKKPAKDPQEELRKLTREAVRTRLARQKAFLTDLVTEWGKVSYQDKEQIDLAIGASATWQGFETQLIEENDKDYPNKEVVAEITKKMNAAKDHYYSLAGDLPVAKVVAMYAGKPVEGSVYANGQLYVEVPEDGTYRMPIHSARQWLKRLSDNFPTSPSPEHKLEGATIKGGSPMPKVSKNPKEKVLLDVLKDYARKSDDGWQGKPYVLEGHAAATDGRRLVVVKGRADLAPKSDDLTGTRATKSMLEAYGLKVSGDSWKFSPDLKKLKADTAPLYRILQQAVALATPMKPDPDGPKRGETAKAMEDHAKLFVNNPVAIHEVNGEIMIRAEAFDQSGFAYVSGEIPAGNSALMVLNGKWLMEALEVHLNRGAPSVTLRFKNDQTVFVEGTDVVHLIMGMRLEEKFANSWNRNGLTEPYKPEDPKPSVQAMMVLPGLLDRIRVRRGLVIPAGLKLGTDPEVSQRLEAARWKPDTWAKELKANVTEFLRNFNRYNPALDPVKDAEMQESVRMLVHARTVADAEAAGMVYEVASRLNGPEQYAVFSRLLIARDVLKDVNAGMHEGGRIPFWTKPEDVASGVIHLPRDQRPDVARLVADLEQLEALAEANADIQDAMGARASIFSDLKRKLVAADLLNEDVLASPDYFHRETLKYLELDREARRTGKGKGAHEATAGFQKRRIGSGEDFNTEYVDAEYRVLADMLGRLRHRDALVGIKARWNLAGAVRLKTRLDNEARANEIEQRLTKSPLPVDLFGGYRRQIHEAQQSLMEMIYNHGVPIPDRFTALEEAVRASIEAYRVETEGMTPREIAEAKIPPPSPPGAHDLEDGDGGWFEYLTYLVQEGRAGSREAKSIFLAIQDRRKLAQEKLGKEYLDWRKNLPEGMALWQPEQGNILFPVMTVTERFAAAILDEHGQWTKAGVEELFRTGEIKDPVVELRSGMALGGPKPTWVLPEQLAAALDDLAPAPRQGLERQLQRVSNYWKQWTLLNPFKMGGLVYNVNNFAGDLDAAFATAGLGWVKQVKAAWAAVKDTNKPITQWSPLAREMFELRVINSGFSTAEVKNFSDHEVFDLVMEERPNVLKRMSDTYWRKAKGFTAIRENLIRAALYLHFKEKVKAGGALGASHPQVLEALVRNGTNAMAAKLTVDALIDYGAISRSGQAVRDSYIPFWSWMEGNFKRYIQLFRNLAKAETAKERAVAARAIGVKGAGTAVRIAAWKWLLAHLVMGAVIAWNRMFFAEEDDEVNRDANRLFLILGRNPDGTVRLFRFDGALSNFYGWIGLSNPVAEGKALMNGEKTVKDEAKRMATEPFNRILSGVLPISKAVVEAGLGRTFFPDMTRPTEIRDPWQHLAKTLGVQPVYDRLTGKPRLSFQDGGWLDLVAVKMDPGELAYLRARRAAGEFVKQMDPGRGEGSYTGDRSTALYYHRAALRMGDAPAAQRYLEQYFNLGGNLKDMEDSLESGDPSRFVPQKMEKAWVESWTAAQKADLQKAVNWYRAQGPVRGGRAYDDPNSYYRMVREAWQRHVDSQTAPASK